MSQHAHTAAAATRRRIASHGEQTDAWGALGIAGLCLLGLALTWTIAELVPAVQVKDAVLRHDFIALNTPHLEVGLNFLLDLVEPLPFTIWGVALVMFALAFHRPRLALAVALVMGLAPLSADLLKPLLAHPHVRLDATSIGPASWPSGHSTAVLVLAMCAVLVAPAHLRRTVAVLGAALTVGVGCALLILNWHMPSDVVGGYLLAALWMALAVAALRAADRRWPPRSAIATS